MRRPPLPLPAVVPSACLVLGAALPAPETPVALWAALALAAVGLAVRSSPRRPFALALLALSVGGGAAARARDLADAGLRPWLPAGELVATEIRGVVRRAPERGRDGEILLELLLRPFPDPRPDAPEARARLTVRAGDEAATARILSLGAGDRVRAWARVRDRSAAPGVPFDAARLALLSQGLDLTGSVKSPLLVRLDRRGTEGPALWIDRLLAGARERIGRRLPAGPRRDVVLAMLLGDRAGMGEEAARVLRDAGLFHLLAISGLHVALFLGAVLFVVRRCGAPPSAIAIVAIPLLWGFAILTGGRPPVARACAAVGLALVGRALGRDVDARNTLALAAAGIVLHDPFVVRSVSFQLTVAATAGILAGAGRIARAIPAPRPAALALGVSLSAYLATAPLLALRLGRLAPAALVANLAAAPLCGLVLLSGAATVALSGVPLLGAGAAALAGGAVDLLLGSARLAGALPFASLRVAAPPVAWIVLHAILLLGAPFDPKRSAGRLLGAAVLLSAFGFHLGPPPIRSGDALAVIDVGQGQAVALRGPGGRCALVDAGGTLGGAYDVGERIVTPFLLAWGCRRLDAVVLTHAHDDHAGGIPAVVGAIDTGTVWIGAGSARDEGTARVMEAAREAGAGLGLATRGRTIEAAGARLAVVHPEVADARLAVNDRCVAVRIATASGARALVPGDLEEEGEARLARREGSTAFDVLVAAHHGAARSSTAAFLASARARFVVVSAGRGNRFGHPAPATITRLRAARATLFRTDRDGTIVFDGRSGRFVPEGISVGEEDRHRDEREDEDQEQERGDEQSTAVERYRVVRHPRMPIAQYDEDDDPQRVGTDLTVENGGNDDPTRQAGEGRPREDPMPFPRDREDRVAPVELTDRKEIHRRDQDPHPTRSEQGTDQEVGLTVEGQREEANQEGIPE